MEFMSKKLDYALEIYTKARQLVLKLENENLDVFVKHNTLEKRLEEAEIELKKVAAEEGDIENKFIKVSVARPFKKWYDYNVVVKMATPEELDPISKILPEVRIDKKEFDILIKENKVRSEIAVKAFREEAQTPRVTIKDKDEK